MRVKHKKRGTVYNVIGIAELQSEQPANEGALLVVYQGSDGKFWVRPEPEFNDGRFETAP